MLVSAVPPQGSQWLCSPLLCREWYSGVYIDSFGDDLRRQHAVGLYARREVHIKFQECMMQYLEGQLKLSIAIDSGTEQSEPAFAVAGDWTFIWTIFGFAPPNFLICRCKPLSFAKQKRSSSTMYLLQGWRCNWARSKRCRFASGGRGRGLLGQFCPHAFLFFCCCCCKRKCGRRDNRSTCLFF